MYQIQCTIKMNKPDSYVMSVELGSGWGAIVFESEVEFDFIEENLKTDQDQEYFVNGSFYDESFFAWDCIFEKLMEMEAQRMIR